MGTSKTLAPAQIEMLEQGRYSDLAVPGLCLKVDDKGRRTWWYRRRVARKNDHNQAVGRISCLFHSGSSPMGDGTQ